eukprot:PhF_6_TR21703/c0_g1_i2/m.30997/K16675/ZDHHC9_14_18; palmitoyltransferase ZDHHC9/14/18
MSSDNRILEHPLGTWLYVPCVQCTTPVLFQYYQYQMVSCGNCGYHNPTAHAIPTPAPSAFIQMQSITDIERLRTEAGDSSPWTREKMQKKLAQRMAWLVTAWNVVERVVCMRKPDRFGNRLGSEVKVYGNGKATSPNSGFVIVPLCLIFFCVLGVPDEIRFSTFASVVLPLLCLTMIHWTEPGYIPRPEHPAPPPPGNSIVETLPNGTPITRVWCTTCKIIRPIGTSHCRSCDACVRGFDHHCFIVGACIGERNVRWFVLFLIFTWMATIRATYYCITTPFVGEGNNTVLRPFVFMVLLPCDFGLIGMFVQCLRNIRRGATLHQTIRRLPVPDECKGGYHNCAKFWCHGSEPSLVIP